MQSASESVVAVHAGIFNSEVTQRFVGLVDSELTATFDVIGTAASKRGLAFADVVEACVARYRDQSLADEDEESQDIRRRLPEFEGLMKVVLLTYGDDIGRAGMNVRVSVPGPGTFMRRLYMALLEQKVSMPWLRNTPPADLPARALALHGAIRAALAAFAEERPTVEKLVIESCDSVSNPGADPELLRPLAESPPRPATVQKLAGPPPALEPAGCGTRVPLSHDAANPLFD